MKLNFLLLYISFFNILFLLSFRFYITLLCIVNRKKTAVDKN